MRFIKIYIIIKNEEIDKSLNFINHYKKKCSYLSHIYI